MELSETLTINTNKRVEPVYIDVSQLLTIPKYAEEYNVDKNTLYKRAYRKEIPVIEISGIMFIKRP